MEIVLRNGRKIKLDWSPLVLEYLEEYDGGIEQLQKDIEDKKSRFRTFNFIIYCVISATYPEELTYREAVSLVDINDLEKIVFFIIKNVNNMKKSDFNDESKKMKKFETRYNNYKPHRR